MSALDYYRRLALVAVLLVPLMALGSYAVGMSEAKRAMSGDLQRERALRVAAEGERDRWASDAITHRVRAIDWQLCSRGEQHACEKAREDEERRRSSGAPWGRS